MPRIDALRRADRRRAPQIGALRNVITVCTTVERPDGDVSTIVNRPGVIQVHASVRPLRGLEMLDYKAVFNVFADTRPKPTHEIVLRTPPDVKIDLNHWVYCKDRFAETWYKVRYVEDMGGAFRFTVLLCTVETINDIRSDPATQTPPPTWERPDDMTPVDEVI